MAGRSLMPVAPMSPFPGGREGEGRERAAPTGREGEEEEEEESILLQHEVSRETPRHHHRPLHSLGYRGRIRGKMLRAEMGSLPTCPASRRQLLILRNRLPLMTRSVLTR